MGSIRLTPTSGERMAIDRRRRGLSKRDHARLLDLGFRPYLEMEADRRRIGQRIAVAPLAEGEIAYLLRRRSGLSRSQVARRAGVSEFWLTQIERGRAPAGRLIEFWLDPKRRGRGR